MCPLSVEKPELQMSDVYTFHGVAKPKGANPESLT